MYYVVAECWILYRYRSFFLHQTRHLHSGWKCIFLEKDVVPGSSLFYSIFLFVEPLVDYGHIEGGKSLVTSHNLWTEWIYEFQTHTALFSPKIFLHNHFPCHVNVMSSNDSNIFRIQPQKSRRLNPFQDSGVARYLVVDRKGLMLFAFRMAWRFRCGIHGMCQ